MSARISLISTCRKVGDVRTGGQLKDHEGLGFKTAAFFARRAATVKIYGGMRESPKDSSVIPMLYIAPAFGMLTGSPMHILLYFLLTLHILTCLLIVLVVLMQRPRSEGLGAAFGSGMTDNIFGAQTTHVLAKFTTYLGGTFFVLTLALAMVYSHIYNGESQINKQLMSMPEPKAAAATPAPVDKPLPAASAATATPAPVAPAVASTPAQAPVAVPATPAPQPVAPLAPATPAPTTP